ncbi:MAG: serine/threonine-protein kinase [Planctomycetota bacterium]|nr:serine/threonine-protein kinase [Planctomycetota bacterium]
MASWKRYGYALARGAVKAIPLAGPILEEVIRVIDEEDMLANKRVATAIEEATIHIDFGDFEDDQSLETLSIEASQIIEDSVEHGASKAWSILPEASQKSLRKKAKFIFAEEDDDDKKELTAEFLVELSQSLFEVETFQDAVTQCVSVAGESVARAPVKARLISSGTGAKVIDGRFEIVKEIGQGGFGSVYIAKDRTFDMLCALKVAKVSGNEFEERFRREARVGFRLGQNTGIVRAYHMGSCENDTKLYLAMDFVPDASDLNLKTGALKQRLKRFLKAARLVESIHKSGVIHRDIKPANFLESPDGAIHLTDFGLAKVKGVEEFQSDQDVSLSGQAGMRGTPAYMPPEQYQDFKKADERTDIYALGVMLYELLTNKRPLHKGPPSHYIRQHLAIEMGKAAIVRPEVENPEISKAVADLCMGCLEMDREQRTSSVSLIIQSIEAQLKNPVKAPEAVKDPVIPAKISKTAIEATKSSSSKKGGLDYQKFLGQRKRLALPYLKGKTVHDGSKELTLISSVKPGWWNFTITGSNAKPAGKAKPKPLTESEQVTGAYLKGSLIGPDGQRERLYLGPKPKDSNDFKMVKARRWHCGRLIYEDFDPENEWTDFTRDAYVRRISMRGMDEMPASLKAAFVYALVERANNVLGETIPFDRFREKIDELAEGGWMAIQAEVRALRKQG